MRNTRSSLRRARTFPTRRPRRRSPTRPRPFRQDTARTDSIPASRRGPRGTAGRRLHRTTPCRQRMVHTRSDPPSGPRCRGCTRCSSSNRPSSSRYRSRTGCSQGSAPWTRKFRPDSSSTPWLRQQKQLRVGTPCMQRSTLRRPLRSGCRRDRPDTPSPRSPLSWRCIDPQGTRCTLLTTLHPSPG